MSANALSRRSALLIAALAVASIGATPAEAGGAARTAKVGKSYRLQLDGTPGPGYVWQYDAADSVNGGIVTVTPLGYGQPSGRRVGAPVSYAFRITPLSPGRARPVFDYLRPWEGTPVRRQEHSVDIAP